MRFLMTLNAGGRPPDEGVQVVEQIRVPQQGLAEEATVSEDRDCLVQQPRTTLEQGNDSLARF